MMTNGAMRCHLIFGMGINMTNDPFPRFRFEPNSRAILEKAVEDGSISRAAVVSGAVRYWGSDDDYHYFKHKDTKAYIKVAS